VGFSAWHKLYYTLKTNKSFSILLDLLTISYVIFGMLASFGIGMVLMYFIQREKLVDAPIPLNTLDGPDMQVTYTARFGPITPFSGNITLDNSTISYVPLDRLEQIEK
jgi:hypothetical protein